MRKGALFVFPILARFSLDSALTKIPIAKMAASQKNKRAALDIFIVLVLFYAPAFGISLCRIAPDALRFSGPDTAHATAKKANKILKQQRQNLSRCNKKVTGLLLLRYEPEASEIPSRVCYGCSALTGGRLVFTHNNVSAKSAHDLRIPFSITSLLAKENRTRNRWRLF